MTSASPGRNDKAEALRRLHTVDPPLLLPNAWDAASAVVFDRAGARAVGTTSLGIANALGYSDGEAFLPPDEMLWMVAHIVAAVDLPVTADIEAGYGNVGETASAAIAAGAAGLNVEDHVGLETHVSPLPDALAAIAEVRSAGSRAGIEIVINARTDVLLHGGNVADAVDRGRAFLDAGADCVFVVGVSTKSEVEQIVREIPGPVNVLAGAAGLTPRELASLGVTRISLGGAAFRAAMRSLQDAAHEFIAGDADVADGLPDFNQMFRSRADTRRPVWKP